MRRSSSSSSTSSDRDRFHRSQGERMSKRGKFIRFGGHNLKGDDYTFPRERLPDGTDGTELKVQAGFSTLTDSIQNPDYFVNTGRAEYFDEDPSLPKEEAESIEEKSAVGAPDSKSVKKES